MSRLMPTDLAKLCMRKLLSRLFLGLEYSLKGIILRNQCFREEVKRSLKISLTIEPERLLNSYFTKHDSVFGNFNQYFSP